MRAGLVVFWRWLMLINVIVRYIEDRRAGNHCRCAIFTQVRWWLMLNKSGTAGMDAAWLTASIAMKPALVE